MKWLSRLFGASKKTTFDGKKAQTSMEYIFLIGGVIFLVTFAYIAVRGGVIQQSEEQITNQTSVIAALKEQAGVSTPTASTPTPAGQTPTPTATPTPTPAPTATPTPIPTPVPGPTWYSVNYQSGYNASASASYMLNGAVYSHPADCYADCSSKGGLAICPTDAYGKAHPVGLYGGGPGFTTILFGTPGPTEADLYNSSYGAFSDYGSSQSCCCGTPSFKPTDICFDSKVSQNFFNPNGYGLGTITLSNWQVGDYISQIPVTDACVDANTLQERYCLTPTTAGVRRVYCRNGCNLFLSISGGCKPAGGAQPAPVCADSDGGADWGVKGTTTLANQTYTETYTDHCEGEYLREYYCSPAANTVGDAVKTCEYGCSDGVCTQPAPTPTPTCFDSDGGKNYGTAGKVTSGSTTLTDYCPNSHALLEYYCSTPTQVTSIEVGCASCGYGGVCTSLS